MLSCSAAIDGSIRRVKTSTTHQADCLGSFVHAQAICHQQHLCLGTAARSSGQGECFRVHLGRGEAPEARQHDNSNAQSVRLTD